MKVLLSETIKPRAFILERHQLHNSVPKILIGKLDVHPTAATLTVIFLNVLLICMSVQGTSYLPTLRTKNVQQPPTEFDADKDNIRRFFSEGCGCRRGGHTHLKAMLTNIMNLRKMTKSETQHVRNGNFNR